jgi:hypothetical protein
LPAKVIKISFENSGLLIYVMVHRVASAVNMIPAHSGKITQPGGQDAPEATARFSHPIGNIPGSISSAEQDNMSDQTKNSSDTILPSFTW